MGPLQLCSGVSSVGSSGFALIIVRLTNDFGRVNGLFLDGFVLDLRRFRSLRRVGLDRSGDVDVVRSHWNQSEVLCALDSARQSALVFRSHAQTLTGNQFAALAHETPHQLNVFVVDILALEEVSSASSPESAGTAGAAKSASASATVTA